jgi:hypothetical protein
MPRSSPSSRLLRTMSVIEQLESTTPSSTASAPLTASSLCPFSMSALRPVPDGWMRVKAPCSGAIDAGPPSSGVWGAEPLLLLLAVGTPDGWNPWPLEELLLPPPLPSPLELGKCEADVEGGSLECPSEAMKACLSSHVVQVPMIDVSCKRAAAGRARERRVTADGHATTALSAAAEAPHISRGHLQLRRGQRVGDGGGPHLQHAIHINLALAARRGPRLGVVVPLSNTARPKTCHDFRRGGAELEALVKPREGLHPVAI